MHTLCFAFLLHLEKRSENGENKSRRQPTKTLYIVQNDTAHYLLVSFRFLFAGRDGRDYCRLYWIKRTRFILLLLYISIRFLTVLSRPNDGRIIECRRTSLALLQTYKTSSLVDRRSRTLRGFLAGSTKIKHFKKLSVYRSRTRLKNCCKNGAKYIIT